jgi:hypothetical protein
LARLAILYDGKTLAGWQKRAIELTTRGNDLFFLITEGESRVPRRAAGHAFYYLLNLLTIRKAQARAAYEHRCPGDESCFHFDPLYEGLWARLPPEALQWLRRQKIDAVLKFGLNLLKVDAAAPPIVS